MTKILLTNSKNSRNLIYNVGPLLYLLILNKINSFDQFHNADSTSIEPNSFVVSTLSSVDFLLFKTQT